MAKANTKQPTTYAVGDRVYVSNGATSGANCTGTVIEASKGWYNIKLDDPEACDKEVVSARAGSMLPMTTAPAGAPVPTEVAEPDGGATEAVGDPSEDGDEDQPLTAAQRMSQALKQARQRYVKVKRPNGAASACNGDKIAKSLQDLEPVETAYMADRVLDVEQGTHIGKYGHLNPGQVRMNSGNRIRAYWKSLIAEGNIDEMTRVGRLLGFIGEDETAEGLYGK